MRKLYLVLLIHSLFVNYSLAQTFDLGTWSILNVKYNLNEKWSVWGEGQIRSLKFFTNFHYYEYKGGINYKSTKNLALTIGTGSYQTYREGGDFVLPKNNDEFRIWPQVILNQSINKFKIEQRYRVELRFTNNGYRNRFRYRLGLSYPLGKQKDEYNPLQINLSNEIFFTDNEPYFERNRMLFSINYKPTKVSTIQIGYLHQFDYKIDDETGRDFLQIGYFIDIFPIKSSHKTSSNAINDN